MASYAVAFYRYGLSALILFPVLLRLPAAQLKTVIWGVASGVAVGLGWVGYVSALMTVPVSTVGVLYITYPVFTILIGWLWFQDKPSNRALCATAIVIAAAVIASSPAAVEPRHLPAMLVSLTAPISFGLGINILIHKLTPINALARVASFTLGASASLLPLLMLSEPRAVLPQDIAGWQLIAGLALGTALLPQLLYTIFAPMIGAARSAVAGSIELPTMFFVGWFGLGEVVGPAQWLGCLLITLAILLTPARATRNLTTQMVLPGKKQ
ncbi:MAG: EamA family transporter [Gammaproteobacteria bacterium]|nr:EamA family transporter [Gammaproteobacteria bacterium]